MVDAVRLLHSDVQYFVWDVCHIMYGVWFMVDAVRLLCLGVRYFALGHMSYHIRNMAHGLWGALAAFRCTVLRLDPTPY